MPAALAAMISLSPAIRPKTTQTVGREGRRDGERHHAGDDERQDLERVLEARSPFRRACWTTPAKMTRTVRTTRTKTKTRRISPSR